MSTFLLQALAIPAPLRALMAWSQAVPLTHVGRSDDGDNSGAAEAFAASRRRHLSNFDMSVLVIDHD